MTLAAPPSLAGTTFAISDTPVSGAEASEDQKNFLEAFGCTADENEKSESSVFAFEVDNTKCKDKNETSNSIRICKNHHYAARLSARGFAPWPRQSALVLIVHRHRPMTRTSTGLVWSNPIGVVQV